MTKEKIDYLLKTNPELIGKRLYAYQQRMDILLELLNDMNEQMLQIRLKDLTEKESV